MVNQIETYLESFTSIELEKLNSVALLNRFDSKYVLPINRLPAFIKLLSSSYNILKIDEARTFDYSTLYYDTPDNQMYYNHVRGKLNRFKVRRRKYNTTGESFLEVKFKNNKSRTIKHRYEQPFNYWVESVLREMRVLPSGFSKYCFGKLLTDPMLTHAKLLKPRIRQLEKITNYAVSFN
ncbi:MAG: VTC domain-containing protein [Bacteroidota bacterium]